MSASVLPARAGMSPYMAFTSCSRSCAPRTGGDEPPHTPTEVLASQVLPARAGMSPQQTHHGGVHVRAPRTGGDEP